MGPLRVTKQSLICIIICKKTGKILTYMNYMNMVKNHEVLKDAY